MAVAVQGFGVAPSLLTSSRPVTCACFCRAYWCVYKRKPRVLKEMRAKIWCVCVCVCVLCMYVCMYACMYVCMYV